MATAERLPRPATYAGAVTRSRPAPVEKVGPREQEQLHVWHICAEHPRASYGDCSPACRSFCGIQHGPSRQPVVIGIHADTCVVCIELAGSARR